VKKYIVLLVPLLLLGLAGLFWVLSADWLKEPGPAHDLSGEITLDGQAVPSGQIFFLPPKGTEGSKVNVAIENGRYSTAAVDRALPVGPARVEIHMLIDGSLRLYQAETELPPVPGTKDFAVTKAETRAVPSLGAPSMGGGGGKGKK